MDRLRPSYLTRDQLRSFLGDRSDLVRAFETFVDALANDMPDELADLQISAATTAALLTALTQATDNDRRDSEAARVLALSAQVDQLREQLGSGGSDSTLTDLAAQFAQLREQVAYMGLRRKPAVAGSITIGAGVASNTFTITPGVASVDLCDLVNLGATATAAAGTTDAAVALDLTNTTTITARRIGTAGTVVVYFRLTEFAQ
jgi:hypothetical protein